MKPETRLQVAAQTSMDATDEGYVIDDPVQAFVPLPNGLVPGFTRLANMTEKTNRWLWRDYIPHGAITLIIGDPGLGKSQVTLDLAARVTQAMPWPDGSIPDVANVLLLASEDSIERTVMPRLRNSGANLQRVIVMDDTQEEGRRMLDLKTDLALLERLIVDNHVEVVILDPLNGYLGNTNSWRESDVRSVLMPIRAVAERHDVAVIGVIHLNKDNTRAAIHRAQGSVAFTAVARAVFAVAAHPTYQGLRYFVSVKQNYAQHPPTLAFVMAPGGGVEWDGQTYPNVTADSLLAIVGAPEEKAERKNARTWLQTTLAAGPVKIKDIVRLAKECAITDRALHRAKYDLKAQSVKIGSPQGTGLGGYWEWRLP